MEQEDKNIRSSCRKSSIDGKKNQLWQHKDRNFWREKSVCCLNVKFSFYFLYILFVVGEWKWGTEELYWIQWLVPAVSTGHLSLWNASWFSKVPSGNKCPHILAPGGESWFLQHRCSSLETATLGFRHKSCQCADWGGFSSALRSHVTWAFHETQTGARLYPFLQMLHKQEAAGFSRTHREPRFCFVNSAAAHQTFGGTPLPRPDPEHEADSIPSFVTCSWNASPPLHSRLCAGQHHSGDKWTWEVPVHLYPQHTGSVSAWGALLGERLSHHPPRFSISQPCTAGLVPCLRSSSWSGATARCSAQVGLFFSQLTGDGLTPQLQPLVIPPYSVKFHPFTAS